MTPPSAMQDARPAAPPRSSRFFVALRPDARAAAGLASLAGELAARCRGKALAAHDLHLTLAFIGERPLQEAAPLAALLDGLPARLPGFVLDAIGRFGAALLWAGARQAPAWLDDLARSTRARLDAAGIEFDRRELRPHLTLVRNARARAVVVTATGPLAHAVAVADWQLVLGGTHEAATAARRYRWYAGRSAPD